MGLPSGTLWLDRLVGAQSPTSVGLYYQWGAVNGHTATDGYRFDADSYSRQGLNAITGNLTESEDAARAFYGPSAKMPSEEQVQELLQYTARNLEQYPLIKFTSLINGNSIVLYRGGLINNTEIINEGKLRGWMLNYRDNEYASALHDATISYNGRYQGLNVMAVHS